MTFGLYSTIRYFTCMAVAFVPRRIDNAIKDMLVVVANNVVPPGEPIIFTDYEGNEVIL